MFTIDFFIFMVVRRACVCVCVVVDVVCVAVCCRLHFRFLLLIRLTEVKYAKIVYKPFKCVCFFFGQQALSKSLKEILSLSCSLCVVC